jgi:hypothetical protein
MPAFQCPDCHAMSFAVHRATYYWCDCGQPLTAADAVPGMATGLADQTPSGPVPSPAADEAVAVNPPSESEAEELEPRPAEQVAPKQRTDHLPVS